MSSSCLDVSTGENLVSLPCFLIRIPGAVLLLPLLCSFPLVCMGGKVTQMYEVQPREIVNILKCVYWELCNSMWEGLSCNRIKFNYLQPKVVNIEQFKDQFPSLSICSCSQNFKKCKKKNASLKNESNSV